MKLLSRARFKPHLLSLLILTALETQSALASTNDTLVVSAAPGSSLRHEDATQKSAMLGNAGQHALRNTPFSVQSLSRELMKQQQLKSVSDLYRYMPSVQGDGARYAGQRGAEQHDRRPERRLNDRLRGRAV